MRVFVTGATGFIGSALVVELVGAGHEVVGLTRSEAGKAALEVAGAEAHFGGLDDLPGLAYAASQADAVVHLAFNHDFSTYIDNCEADRRIIGALGSALTGSKRPLLVTSGTGMVAKGRPVTESDPPASSAEFPRAASEEAAAELVAGGVNVGVVRLPQIHDPEHHGLLTYAIQVAREAGVSAYVGDGANAWAAAHISDTARLYRLALERAEPGARYHAVGEEGVPMREVAEAIGKRLSAPVSSIAPGKAGAHFAWLATLLAGDGRASSELTQERLGWTPVGPGLLEDLEGAGANA